MKIDIRILEKKLKINLKNKALLLTALTHKSKNPNINNEKLEFLGDRVIGLVLSKKLIDLYPNAKEGTLDKRFAKLVNRHTCSQTALLMDLQDFILLGDVKKIITYKDEKILSDSCEAIIGAVYLDKGFDFVNQFVLKLWKEKIKESNITILDSKTKLQEYSLKKYRKLPEYKVIEAKGPRHSPTFKISVSISGSKKITGTGNSKQEAQLNAAKDLLKNLKII